MSEPAPPQPLRLAVGTQVAPFACAMQVISWEQGDRTLNPYPTGVARPLAHMVHGLNDEICRSLTLRDGAHLLCPPCSMEVLALAHRTVGTAGASHAQLWRWAAEMLTGERVGILNEVIDERARRVVSDAADVAHQMAAGSDGYFVKIRPVDTSGMFRSDFLRAAFALKIMDHAARWPGRNTKGARDNVFHCLGEQYVDFTVDGPIHQIDRDGRLAACHRVIDAWERATDRHAPAPDMSRVAEFVAAMETA